MLKLNTQEIREDHYQAGFPVDMDCSKHSPLFHQIGKTSGYDDARQRAMTAAKNKAAEQHDTVLVKITESRMEKRIESLEAKHARLTKYTKELAKFVNELEARIEKLEKQNSESLVYTEHSEL